MKKIVRNATLALGLMCGISVLSEAQNVKKEMIVPFNKGKEINAIHNFKVSPRMELQKKMLAPKAPQKVQNNVLPYVQNFNGLKDLSEIGWKVITTHEASGLLGNFQSATGADGQAVCWNGLETSKQDEWLITNAFDLEANKKVYLSFDLFMPGLTGAGGVDDVMEFGVNTTQGKDGVIVLLEVQESTGKAYTTYEAEYTPTSTGTYYFTWHLCTPTPKGNGVGVDNFKARLDGQGFPPVGSIIYHTPNQLGGFIGQDENIKHLVMHNQSTTCYPLWEDAETMRVGWQVDGTAFADMGQYGEISPVFGTTGKHELLLTLTNEEDLSSTISANIDVLTYADANSSQGVFYTQNETEMDEFDVSWKDNGYAIITGFNEYTDKLAQKFDLPKGVSMNVSRFLLPIKYCTLNKLANVTIGFKFIGVAADGYPDESKVLAEGTLGTLSELDNFMQANKTNLVPVDLSSAVNLTGPFFFVLEAQNIPDGFACSEKDYFGIEAYIENIMEGSSPFYLTIDGSWTSIDEMSSNPNQAVGASLFTPLVATLTYDPSSIDAISDITTPTLFVVNNMLHIQNVEVGSNISVYAIDGKQVFSSSYDGENISVAFLAEGVYVVKVGEKSVKIVR